MIPATPSIAPLHTAIAALTALESLQLDDAAWLRATEPVMRTLVANDNWLPASHAVSHPQFYQQHALYVDPHKHFSLSSFVWGPGQGTPVHNHTIPGWVGVLRGAELCQRYSDDGTQQIEPECRLNPGDVGAVSPSDDTVGDVHTVRNAFNDRVSVSVHLYRGDISSTPRSVFKDGEEKDFMSSYSGVGVLVG